MPASDLPTVDTITDIGASLPYTLTTSYGGATSAFALLPDHRHFSVELDFTKGDATSIEIQVQGSRDGGSTWRALGRILQGTDKLIHYHAQIVCADWASPDKVTFGIQRQAFSQYRLLFKRTGGTAGYTIDAVKVHRGVNPYVPQ